MRCPTCYLPTHRAADDDEIEVRLTYRAIGKTPYMRGWYGCSNCLKGLEQTIEDYMTVQRINRGISLRVMEEQTKKSRKSGCGCGG